VNNAAGTALAWLLVLLVVALIVWQVWRAIATAANLRSAHTDRRWRNEHSTPTHVAVCVCAVCGSIVYHARNDTGDVRCESCARVSQPTRKAI
jgi:hypothetical protein